MEAIKTVELTKKYKDITAVDKLHLSVEKGELFALLGVNGAGKSTTVKMLSCLTSPSSGEAFINGKSIIKDKNAVKSAIGISPQETAVAEKLTVRENLSFICGIHGFGKEKTKTKIAEINRQFSLDEVMNRKAGKLSGGYMRRLSIAMALISEPEILFLDEPTLGLDVIARNELHDLIKKLKGSMTVILTTHYMEEAEELSDRIGIMKDGKLLLTGTAAEIKKNAGTDNFEAAFIKTVKGENL